MKVNKPVLVVPRSEKHYNTLQAMFISHGYKWQWAMKSIQNYNSEYPGILLNPDMTMERIHRTDLSPYELVSFDHLIPKAEETIEITVNNCNHELSIEKAIELYDDISDKLGDNLDHGLI